MDALVSPVGLALVAVIVAVQAYIIIKYLRSRGAKSPKPPGAETPTASRMMSRRAAPTPPIADATDSDSADRLARMLGRHGKAKPHAYGADMAPAVPTPAAGMPTLPAPAVAEAAAPSQPQTPADAPHCSEPGPVIIVRQSRTNASDWDGARSWFGGRPALGATPWPRDDKGVPMPFAAQIDLAALAEQRPACGLPDDGWLAFFFDSGAVVHVSATSDGALPDFTDPPPGTPYAYELGRDIFPANPSAWAQQHFPRWPVALQAVDLDPPHDERTPVGMDEDDLWEHRDEIRTAIAASAATLVPQRQYYLHAKSLFGDLGYPATPLWGHGVRQLGDLLRACLEDAPRALAHRDEWTMHATVARDAAADESPQDTDKLAAAEAFLAKRHSDHTALAAQFAALPDAIAAVDALAADYDDWAMLSDTDQAEFIAIYQAIRTELDDAVRFFTPYHWEDLTTNSLRAMMVGDAAAFAALPVSVRDAMNRDGRMPIGVPQQMFGVGIDIQGSASVDHCADVMLLQLYSDDMMDWRFGDNGAFQYWISPADLTAGRWDRASMTFECH